MTGKKSENDRPGSQVRVTFEPMGISCTVPAGQTVLAAAASQGIDLFSECGGKGKCGKCQVEVTPSAHVSAVTANESRLLPEALLNRNGRLACQARVKAPLSVLAMGSKRDCGEPLGKNLDGATLTPSRSRRQKSRALSGSFGLALDIGTTTLALYLCDLRSGTIVHSAAEANPQRRFGADVISRIAHANDQPHGLEELRSIVVEAVNGLIERGLEKTGAEKEDIGKVTVVGNTTMQHLFAGLHPEKLGVYPYLPESCAARVCAAEDLGLALKRGCEVYLFPVISGFVGGDTVGAMLHDRPYCRDEITLLIDIGTNGEIVLGNREAIWAASCATGPALEGAHIACGMRASAGAIDKVVVDPSSYRVDYEIIGGDTGLAPQGLCGSGIIDAVAEMVQAGLILPSGRLCEGLPGVVVDRHGIGREFIIADNTASPESSRIVLTLADVRQVQLAKSALYSGIKLLLKKAGIDKIDRLVLTGAFGARFNWRNGVAIGMLPETAEEAQVVVVENGAGRGAVMALLDAELREEARIAAAHTRLLELGGDPDFAREFALNTSFPQRRK